MIRGNNIYRFLRGCSDHRDQLFCLFELKSFLGLTDGVSVGEDYYTICNTKITYQCKITIVPEEGWFGQPKYSTPTKKSFYVVSTSASIFSQNIVKLWPRKNEVTIKSLNWSTAFIPTTSATLHTLIRWNFGLKLNFPTLQTTRQDFSAGDG